MQNYDFNDFLKAIRHFGRQDKIDASRLKVRELEQKNRSGSDRRQAELMLQQIKALLRSLS